MNRDRLDFDASSSVVNQSHVSETATLMIRVGGVSARLRGLEPIWLVHTSILGGIGADVGYPQRALGIRETDELVLIYVANLQCDMACDVDSLVVVSSLQVEAS